MKYFIYLLMITTFSTWEITLIIKKNSSCAFASYFFLGSTHLVILIILVFASISIHFHHSIPITFMLIINSCFPFKASVFDLLNLRTLIVLDN
jgi:hypothetical protein